MPIPPAALVGRVGANAVGDFERVGRELKAQIIHILPADWSFQGKCVLDFGCGAGRLLRHFLIEAETAEFHGCDIDAESIEWLERHLSPPVHVFRNDENPPLPFEDGTLDLVIATSVFTHLSDTWSSWLVEMHRLIAPNGLLVATFLGRDIIGTFDEEWDDERIGMNVLRPLQSWDLGGPMVFHSEWWLREHWGRAFEILVLREQGFTASVEPHLAQGVVLLRKKAVHVSPEMLEEIDPDDPREVLALRHNITQLGRESHAFQQRAEWLRQEVASLARQPETLSPQDEPRFVDDGVPIPPAPLARRVGSSDAGDFLRVGRELKAQIVDILPADWSFESRRVLDFGCGPGRLLAHFLPEAETGEFHGCDIDAESIEWLERELSPPMHVFRNDETPPLPFEDGTFDLVLAASVFTHLSKTWSDWLVELHRLLADDGLLVATYLGRDVIGTYNEEWDDDRIGMNVLRPEQGWEIGGPVVLHSSWWLREHWGRAFHVVVLREAGSVAPGFAHGMVLLRKKSGRVTPDELERIDAGDPRELAALGHNIAQLGRESRAFQLQAAWFEQEIARLEHERAEGSRAHEGRLRRALSRLSGKHRGS